MSVGMAHQDAPETESVILERLPTIVLVAGDPGAGVEHVDRVTPGVGRDVSIFNRAWPHFANILTSGWSGEPIRVPGQSRYTFLASDIRSKAPETKQKR